MQQAIGRRNPAFNAQGVQPPMPPKPIARLIAALLIAVPGGWSHAVETCPAQAPVDAGEASRESGGGNSALSTDFYGGPCLGIDCEMDPLWLKPPQADIGAIANDTYKHEKRWNEVQDPIDLRSGNKRHEEVDYAPLTPAPLRIARTYNSLNSAAPAQVRIALGAGWRSVYDRSLQVLGASLVRLHRDNGDTEDFSLAGGIWASTRGKGALTSVAGGWRYVNPGNVVEAFDNTGRLVSLSHEGRLQTLAYDAANRLVIVSDTFGRSINFGYDGAGRVSSITLPGGAWVAYTYDGANRLTAVRYADGTVSTYAYENTSFPHALTGITDAAGRR